MGPATPTPTFIERGVLPVFLAASPQYWARRPCQAPGIRAWHRRAPLFRSGSVPLGTTALRRPPYGVRSLLSRALHPFRHPGDGLVPCP